MTDKVPIRRLPTGVPGLDAVLGGGCRSSRSTSSQARREPARRRSRSRSCSRWHARIGPPSTSPCSANRRSRCSAISSSSSSSTSAKVNASVRFVNLAKEALDGGLERGAEAHRPGSGGGVARDRDRRLVSIGHPGGETAERSGSTCSTSSRSWACG